MGKVEKRVSILESITIKRKKIFYTRYFSFFLIINNILFITHHIHWIHMLAKTSYKTDTFDPNYRILLPPQLSPIVFQRHTFFSYSSSYSTGFRTIRQSCSTDIISERYSHEKSSLKLDVVSFSSRKGIFYIGEERKPATVVHVQHYALFHNT